MSNIKVPIKGMHCASCEILIGDELKKIPGVKSAKLDHKKGEAVVSFADQAPTPEQLSSAVEAAGYKIGKKEDLPWISTKFSDYADLAKAAGILLVVYLMAKWLGLFNLDVSSESGGVFVALVVGLVAGVSTCMALIGGLVLGLSARHAELHPEATAYQKFRPHLYFNLGRIAGYAILGGLIGLIGSAFRLSTGVLGLLTMLVGGVMIFFGLKLIEIFPVLRDKSITLPTSIARLFGISSNVKEYSHKSAMVMGALTFFLPCGFTQAMQLYAVSTGSFWQGMMIMGLFALGTAPGLLGIGGLTSVFKGKRARIFFMTAGLAVIILGWFNVANASRLLQSGSGAASSVNSTETGDEQVVNMTESGRGYSPNVFTVKKGKPVKWVINATSQWSCASTIVMPAFGINKPLSSGENVILFTPTEVGEIPFSCSMGMYTGKFIVVDDNGAAAPGGVYTQNTNNNRAFAGGCGMGGGGGCGGGSAGGGCGMMRANNTQQNYTPSAAPVKSDGNEQVLNAVYTYDQDIVPSSFTVKRDTPVKFIVDVRENGYGCMSTIMVPGLYENPELLTAGKQIVMSFTPERTGTFQITCAMGVPRGEIKVID